MQVRKSKQIMPAKKIVSRADNIRAQPAKLGITEYDVEEAVCRARKAK